MTNFDIILNGTYEVDSDGWNVRFCICVICKTQQQTRFANTRVSNQQQFEQIITKIQQIYFKSSIFFETYYSGLTVAIAEQCTNWKLGRNSTNK